ncbi:MAG TPA: 50S ribosomal protein L37e [Euryarchaeota archaeon]|nr:50S ribosomal protein L37e [Euryarchaeota archaeon]HDY73947.1 50S ribosomal protein L37e [Euryarchaeota archaeon]
MSKGTPSKGPRNKVVHARCRRCGKNSYHVRQKACSSCGFGRSSRLRSYAWREKRGK